MIFTVTSKGTGVAVGVNVGVAVGNGVAVQAAAVMVATSSADGPQLASRRIAANKRAAKTFFIVELLHISVDFLAKKDEELFVIRLCHLLTSVSFKSTGETKTAENKLRLPVLCSQLCHPAYGRLPAKTDEQL